MRECPRQKSSYATTAPTASRGTTSSSPTRPARRIRSTAARSSPFAGAPVGQQALLRRQPQQGGLPVAVRGLRAAAAQAEALRMHRPRTSGILLHPTSLPGRFGIGELGPEAIRFADFLAAAGQRLWQVLP